LRPLRQPQTASLPQYIIDGYPALARISNILDEAGKPIGVIDAGRVWHSDGAFAERPNMYSMLYALEIPRDDTGRPLGATLFVSTAHAYDTLPAEVKARVAGLRASNSLAAVYRSLGEEITKKRAPLNDEQKREFLHPVVRTHPVTGRKCIYVSRAATMRIEGLSEAESSALIDELADWCVQEDAIYRHEWREGDLLIWTIARASTSPSATTRCRSGASSTGRRSAGASRSDDRARQGEARAGRGRDDGERQLPVARPRRAARETGLRHRLHRLREGERLVRARRGDVPGGTCRRHRRGRAPVVERGGARPAGFSISAPMGSWQRAFPTRGRRRHWSKPCATRGTPISRRSL
jgi:alpha-ketoglutarate-dependent taurine dioxygenase